MKKFLSLVLLVLISFSFAKIQSTIHSFGNGIFIPGLPPDGKYVTGYDMFSNSAIHNKEDGLNYTSNEGTQA